MVDIIIGDCRETTGLPMRRCLRRPTMLDTTLARVDAMAAGKNNANPA